MTTASADHNVASRLPALAARQGGAAAFVTGTGGSHRTISVTDLDRRVARLAGGLQALGIGTDARVAVLLRVSPELYTVLLALFRLGATAVFPDPQSPRERMVDACRRMKPSALIGMPEAQWLRWAEPAVKAIPIQICTQWWVPFTRHLAGIDGEPAPIAPVTPDHPAMVTFTSGSTGAPKAIARSHGFLQAQQAVIRHTLSPEPGAAALSALPVFGLSYLAEGMTVVIPAAQVTRPEKTDPTPLITQVKEASARQILASPVLAERIADAAPGKLGALASVQRIFTGGGPVYPALLDKLKAAAPEAEPIAVYGSSEAEPIAELAQSALTEDLRARINAGEGLCVGRPIGAIDLRILPDNDGAPIAAMSGDEFETLALPIGTPGEIVVAGDHVLPGYLDGVGDETTKIRVGERVWHRTGDAGRIDADGVVWLLGRCSARLDLRNGRVRYPMALETAAQALFQDRRLAALARNGRAVLVLEGEMPEELDAHALRAIGIDEVSALPRLPMDRRHNSKIDYPRLRAVFEGGPVETRPLD